MHEANKMPRDFGVLLKLKPVHKRNIEMPVLILYINSLRVYGTNFSISYYVNVTSNCAVTIPKLSNWHVSNNFQSLYNYNHLALRKSPVYDCTNWKSLLVFTVFNRNVIRCSTHSTDPPDSGARLRNSASMDTGGSSFIRSIRGASERERQDSVKSGGGGKAS